MPLVPLFVGSFSNGSERELLPVSFAELLRCRNMIERVLRTFDFARGRFVLLISMLDDGAFAVPFERAIMNLGLLATNADNSPYESQRIESICRRFDVAAIAGVTSEVLNGLETAGHSLEAIFANRVVWAFPGAYERLASLSGIQLCKVMEVGPAFGIECSQRNGLHIDASEWDFEESENHVVLTSRLLRSMDFSSYTTAVRAALNTSPCACGNTDIRIVPSVSA